MTVQTSLARWTAFSISMLFRPTSRPHNCCELSRVPPDALTATIPADEAAPPVAVASLDSLSLGLHAR